MMSYSINEDHTLEKSCSLPHISDTKKRHYIMSGGVQMTEKQQRRRFDGQFKLDTLRLIQESNRKISDIARELGIRPELLYRWKSEHAADPEQAFPGKGHMKPEEEYVRRLERELAQARSERDILKKALAYFSKNER